MSENSFDVCPFCKKHPTVDVVRVYDHIDKKPRFTATIECDECGISPRFAGGMNKCRWFDTAEEALEYMRTKWNRRAVNQ